MSKTESFTFFVRPELITAIQEVLRPEETVAQFIEVALSGAVERRQIRRDFIDRAMAARDRARAAGSYVSADEVLKNLENVLKRHSS